MVIVGRRERVNDVQSSNREGGHSQAPHEPMWRLHCLLGLKGTSDAEIYKAHLFHLVCVKNITRIHEYGLSKLRFDAGPIKVYELLPFGHKQDAMTFLSRRIRIFAECRGRQLGLGFAHRFGVIGTYGCAGVVKPVTYLNGNGISNVIRIGLVAQSQHGDRLVLDIP